MSAGRDDSVELSRSGPSETVLDPPPSQASAALERALAAPDEERWGAIADVVSTWPRYVEAWARLGECSSGIGAYAFFRVGYHRGLDQLRGAGWRGSGYVRWDHRENRGFLRALDGLRRLAGEIGEADEERRCAEFLEQLDPDWSRRDTSD